MHATDATKSEDGIVLLGAVHHFWKSHHQGDDAVGGIRGTKTTHVSICI